ncbi:MAG TPA: BTAD domain-containing putative transcriptional regulator, partial [Chthonomonadales bacterium]|nr:BTAD domain-containing putative transcriptional regulator [Chthonomonadales bacterium]
MASRRATPVECGTFDSRIGVPDQEPALWHIELFGRLRATSAERTITRFPAGKARELLARLACYPDREHSREELVELLWPEVEPGAGRLRLRVAINSLRKQLEPPGVAPGTSIVSEGDSIRLDLRAITSDVYQFHGLLRSAQRAAEHDRCAALLAQAVELSECELLPGSYEDWILQERELLAEKRQSALLQLIRLEEEAGNLTGALEYARKSVLAAPEREERHQDLIRLLVLAGRREEAKRQLRKLARTLREQLGGTPRMETRRLLDLQPLPARPPAPPLQVVHAPASQLHARSSLEGAPRLCRLPLTLTRFVGRETELEDLQSLIAGAHSSGCEAVRLVIVTGPGGVGKTRLAIETARRLAAGSGAEALFVGLSDIQDAERMPEATLQALGVPPLPGRKALGQAIGALSQAPEAAEGPLLLLLDNLEHLLQAEAASAAVRSTIGSILRELPRVIVLATSRQITGVSGEREYPLQPLPAPAQSATALRLLDFPSVRLFVDRAQAVRPDFQLTPKNAAAIGAVCERLEGLPLAIELASAWARVLTPQQTLERLDRRFDLLVNRHKSVPERARSLEAAIRWSYDLLSTEQQKLVCRLSVFRGGWTIEAVAAVWADSVSSDVESRTVGLLAARPPLAVGLQGSRPKQDRLSSTILEHTGSGDLVADRQGAVIVALTELAERSIIRMEETETGSRYRMLESVREFMQERMSAAELERAQELHAQWCLNANPQCAPMRAWLDAVEAERHNIAAAIRWCAQGGRGANPASASDRLLLGMRIASKTSRFWVARGYLQEAYGLYSALLSCADQVAPGADA